jgi:D-xylose transport system ATP-binding protein
MPEPLTPILEMVSIVKDFPGVRALDGVDLTLYPAEILALVGENGAGKSTLMKVLAGVYTQGTFSGQIRINGRPVHFYNTAQAQAAGIAVIYQDLNLLPNLTVGENIFLGREPNRLGFIDWRSLYGRSADLLKRFELDVDPRTQLADLGMGRRQVVALARALGFDARILVLDEPTSALSDAEVERLFRILRSLKERGVSSIFISHRLSEVGEIADRVMVLRDGAMVGVKPQSELDQESIISMMVGRKISDLYPPTERTPGKVAFQVRNFGLASDGDGGRPILQNINFQVRTGEVVGIAGLMGSGRTELLMSLFGAYPGRVSGEIEVGGRSVRIKSPRDAINNGISLVTEDRKGQGLIMGMNVTGNITLASLKKFSRLALFIDRRRETRAAADMSRRLKVKGPGLDALVDTLSGGNQQKVVLGKWLATEPKVLFLDEPTQGIDVGAKVEIHDIMNRLLADGVAIIMVSSELPEVIGMSDRVLVLADGKITGELPGNRATEENIMRLAVP